jgi:hypothetical protein
VVENICPRTIALLGGQFDIDTQFFAGHVNNIPWHRIDEVSKRISALPSSEKVHDFMQLRYVDCRPIEKVHGQNSTEPSNDIEAEKSSTSIDQPFVPISDSRSFTYPDYTTTRIVRKAGKLIPTKLQGKSFNTLLFIRNVISAWFGKRTSSSAGWTGTYNSTRVYLPMIDINEVYCSLTLPSSSNRMNTAACLLKSETLWADQV